MVILARDSAAPHHWNCPTFLVASPSFVRRMASLLPDGVDGARSTLFLMRIQGLACV
jgi:hypothetical protein